MAKKQDWTTRPKILGWAVVNLAHADTTPSFLQGDDELPAAVVANESGWIYQHQVQAEDVAAELRREHQNDQIVVVAVLGPGEESQFQGPRRR